MLPHTPGLSIHILQGSMADGDDMQMPGTFNAFDRASRNGDYGHRGADDDEEENDDMQGGYFSQKVSFMSQGFNSTHTGGG